MKNYFNQIYSRFFSVTEHYSDSGIRGNSSGELYVVREIFFKRPEVIEHLSQIECSRELGKMAAESLSHTTKF